jgi:hypothetical protein
MSQEPADIHDMDPALFQERVHSFEFWFEAVQGYLAGKTYGHTPDLKEEDLDEDAKDRLITVLC